MKKLGFNLIVSFLILAPAISQEKEDLHFELSKILPAICLSSENFVEAKSVFDLNPHIKKEWVKEYISTEIVAQVNNKKKRIKSDNKFLSPDQLVLLKDADTGEDIHVSIKYLPNNHLKNNSPKEMNFSFIVLPENDAVYPGGQEAMYEYLKTYISQIPEGVFEGYALAAVKFAINEEGQIIDSNLFSSSEDEHVDNLLLEAICNMPNWRPAKYKDGTLATQEFALMVGNMKSCVVNMLNVADHRMQ